MCFCSANLEEKSNYFCDSTHIYNFDKTTQSMNKDELGKYGEILAINYLTNKGYEILETNWVYVKLELDIIAKHRRKIIVVEVKTRENNYIGEPWEAVTIAKQKRIIKAANEYIVENKIDNEVQFDVISIIHNQRETKIEHLEDAFYPMS